MVAAAFLTAALAGAPGWAETESEDVEVGIAANRLADAILDPGPTKQRLPISSDAEHARTIDPVMTNPAVINLPIMIVAGAASPEASEAKRFGKRIEGIKTRIGRGEAAGYELKLVPTNLSGPSLVNQVSSVIPAIVNFIKNNVEVDSEANAWIERD